MHVDAGATIACEGERRAPPLRVEQLCQAMAAQVGIVPTAGRDEELGGRLIDRDERHELVGGTLDEELDLGVLVGGSHGGKRGGAGLDHATLPVDAFAETLGPKLHKPRGNGAQGVRVGHEHVNIARKKPHVLHVDGCDDPRGILEQRGVLAAFRHVLGAPQQIACIDPGEKQWQQTRRSEHREAPPHVARDGERLEAEFCCVRAQCAALGVGDGDHMLRQGLLAEAVD